MEVTSLLRSGLQMSMKEGRKPPMKNFRIVQTKVLNFGSKPTMDKRRAQDLVAYEISEIEKCACFGDGIDLRCNKSLERSNHASMKIPHAFELDLEKGDDDYWNNKVDNAANP